jgi:hypothetical protein
MKNMIMALMVMGSLVAVGCDESAFDREADQIRENTQNQAEVDADTVEELGEVKADAVESLDD